MFCLRLKTNCSRKTRKLGAMAERVSKMLIDWSAIDDLTKCEERNFLVTAFIASAGDTLFAKSNATKFSLLLDVLKCRLKLLCLRSSCEASYLTIKLLKISYSSRNFINFNCNLEFFNLWRRKMFIVEIFSLCARGQSRHVLKLRNFINARA